MRARRLGGVRRGDRNKRSESSAGHQDTARPKQKERDEKRRVRKESGVGGGGGGGGHLHVHGPVAVGRRQLLKAPEVLAVEHVVVVLQHRKQQQQQPCAGERR